MTTRFTWRAVALVSTLALIAGFLVAMIASPARATGGSDEPCYEWIPETYKEVPNPDYKPAVPGTPAVPAVTDWVNYEWNGGESLTAPAWSDEDNWGVNSGEHAGEPHQPRIDGRTYRTNDNGKPTANWFHWELVVISPEIPEVPETPAVGEPTIEVVDVPGHEEEVECPVDIPLPVPTQFNAEPEDATCLADGFLDLSAFTADEVEGNQSHYSFEKFELYVTRNGNSLLLEIGAEEGYTFENLSEAWVDEGGTFSRTIVLAEQKSGVECDDPTPTESPSPEPSPSVSPSPDPQVTITPEPSPEPTPSVTPEPTPEPEDDTPVAPRARAVPAEVTFTG